MGESVRGVNSNLMLVSGLLIICAGFERFFIVLIRVVNTYLKKGVGLWRYDQNSEIKAKKEK